MGRSKNPDLIFDDILEERARRIAEHYSKNDHQAHSFDLDRVTLFVTHKCNLFCRYCNGPHMNTMMDPAERRSMLDADISLKQYCSLIDSWHEHGLKHIHFTGGEATLHTLLPEFVSMASEKGILSSLTTNGTAPIDLYDNLLDRGLTEIRVSLDSTIDEDFDNIVRVKGACQKVKNNIRNLAYLRDDVGKDLFLVINACVGSFNVDNIENTLSSLIELNPDDIKFLVVAEEGSYVCSKSSRTAVNELLEFAEHQDKHYELLEKKIRGLFRKNTFGLKDHASQHEIHQCFIPLTERTLDARGFYPCSIYLRYNGKPLIGADADFYEQQEAIDHFVETHDCRDDDICIDNCTNCCKEFNLEANRKLHEKIMLQKARSEYHLEVEKVDDLIIDEVKKTYDEIILSSHGLCNPFLIIKPYGMQYQEDILNYLDDQGIKIIEDDIIADWQRCSLFLYFKGADGKNAEFKVARNVAFDDLEKDNISRLLRLEEEIPEKKLFRIKNELRHWYGEELKFFRYQGKEYAARINCIHIPDYKDLVRENKIVEHFLNLC